MNYSKNDLIEAIEANNQVIKEENDSKKKAEKILTLINELSTETATTIFHINDIYDIAMRSDSRIEEAKTRNTKRKKQLKLIEQMEALESEVVGD